VQNQDRPHVRYEGITDKGDVAGNCRDAEGTHRFHGEGSQNQRRRRIADSVAFPSLIGEPVAVFAVRRNSPSAYRDEQDLLGFPAPWA
jgi:hypothetical protein